MSAETNDDSTELHFAAPRRSFSPSSLLSRPPPVHRSLSINPSFSITNKIRVTDLAEEIGVYEASNLQLKNCFGVKKMSFISQHAGPKNQSEKAKRKGSDQPSVLDSDREDNEVTYRVKKKKGEPKEEENTQLEIEQKKEMKELENLLFPLNSPVEFGKQEDTDESSALFFTDKCADSTLTVYEGAAEFHRDTDDEEDDGERKPAWVDDEEENISVNVAKVNRARKLRKDEAETVIPGSKYTSRLRALHEKMNRGTEWARGGDQRSQSYNSNDSDEENGAIKAHEDDDRVDDILRTNEKLVVKSNKRLLPGLLEYSRLVDANAEDPSKGVINSVQFHQNGQLLLTGGLDKKLKFFQIDGKRNTKIQSIHLEDCPISKACFLPDGSQVIVGGRRKFFYSVDLVKASVDKIGPLTGRDERSLEVFEVSPDSNTIAFVGNEGYILLVSTKTKELIGTLKMNGTARSLAFTNDGQNLLSSGGDGHVYHWDLRTRACFHKGVDEGCINGTALCTSPNGSLFATGSDSGIVNVYNREEFLGGKRKPIKTIDNLTTKVSFMKFNHDAQILAISSGMKKNSLKLVHVPSYTVFSNWPLRTQTIHHARCLDFSPGGGFMAMGDAAGKVLLYKLHHYQNA